MVNDCVRRISFLEEANMNDVLAAIFSRISRRRILLGCILIFCATVGFAQVDTGTILGTVKDPQGAVIPGAKVMVTNVDTASTVITTTRSDGTYIITPL